MTKSLSKLDSYVTIQDAVMRKLKNAIVRGELKPGQKINQDALAEALEVSRMPIREALRRLEAQGFVTIYPHRGAVVAPISEDDVYETYLMRTELEALAARLAAPAITEQVSSMLGELLETMADALDRGDSELLAEANRQFHSTGYEASGLTRVCGLISDLRDHSDRHRRYHAALHDRSREAFDEHVRIFEAWKSHDAKAAEHWVRVNLIRSRDAVLKAIRSSPVGDE